MTNWKHFPDLPVGSIFSFGGAADYLKTGDATFREMGGVDRFQRTFAEKDLGKLLLFKKVKSTA